MRKDHPINRRSLVAGLAAMPVAAVAAPRLPAVGVSPRLLELKQKLDKAWARQEVARNRMHEANLRLAALAADDRRGLIERVHEELEPEWEASLEEAQDVARLMFMEPTSNAADFALKLAVWESVIRDSIDDDDDLTEYAGWIDRVLPRLFNDARALLGCPGTVA